MYGYTTSRITEFIYPAPLSLASDITVSGFRNRKVENLN